MKIIVLSDTHGKTAGFERLVAAHRDAELFIHLGDGAADVEHMRASNPETAFITVRGNCDFSSFEPGEKTMEIAGRRLFLTHGHRYGVKSGVGALLSAGRKRNADMILFGHTHLPFCKWFDGTCMINPGSLEFPRNGRPGFGIVEFLSDETCALLREIS